MSNTIPRIIGLLKDDPEKWGVDSDIFKKEDYLVDESIKKDLTWKPETSLEEFKEIKEMEVLKDSKRDMYNIVSGYQEGGLKEISDQEITFVCKEYYLVEDVFIHKMIEYLEQNIPKLSDNSHSE